MLGHYANEGDIPPCLGEEQDEGCVECSFRRECARRDEEYWKWEDIIKNLRNKNSLAIHDSVKFVDDKLNYGFVVVREL